MKDRNDVAGRLVRLRRPPVLNVVPDRWVPEGVDLGEVDALWRVLVESNPRYHDGDCVHVLGVVRNGHAGATIHLAPTSYRFHAVRRLGLDTGVRPLGVKGLCVAPGPDGPGLLAGRRSGASGSYPGCWEYLPGGGVDLRPDGTVDPVATIRHEIRDEIGIEPDLLDPIALAILEDRTVGTWEIVHRAAFDVAPTRPPGWEHDELAVVTPETLPTPASGAAIALAGLARDVLQAARG